MMKVTIAVLAIVPFVFWAKAQCPPVIEIEECIDGHTKCAGGVDSYSGCPLPDVCIPDYGIFYL